MLVALLFCLACHPGDIVAGLTRADSAPRRDDVWAVAIHPGGRSLVFGTERAAVYRWDWTTDRLTRLAEEDSLNHVYTLAFSPDGKRLAYGGMNGLLKVIDFDTGKLRHHLKGAHVALAGLDWSRDGKALVSLDRYGAIRLWDPDLGHCTIQEHASYGSGIAFAPNGRSFYVTGAAEHLKIIDTASGQVQRVVPGQGRVKMAAYSPDGKTIATASAGDGVFRLWDANRFQVVATLSGSTDKLVWAMAFSPDSGTLAVAQSDNWDERRRPGEITIWDVPTGQLRHRLEKHWGGVWSCCFSPDGRMLATGGGDGFVRIWETATWTERYAFSPTRLKVNDKTAPLTDEELVTLGRALDGPDAAAAFRASRHLIQSPDRAVPWIRQRLRLPDPTAAKTIISLIAQLDSDDFPIRQKTTHELEQFSETALPLLRQAYARQDALESRRRVQQLIDRLDEKHGTAVTTRWSRLLEILEAIGTAQARQEMDRLAKSHPDPWLARAAKQGLERLSQR